MRHWIFQANPDRFDVDRYIDRQEEILWSVGQQHYRDQMNPGDRVHIWRAQGRRFQNKVYGVVAEGTISGIPEFLEDDASDLWRGNALGETALRVPVSISKKHLGNRQVIQNKWLVEDPVTSALTILRMRNQTNYLIKESESKRISHLISRTGEDWERQECIAALKAYCSTYGRPISKLSGSPVSDASLLIGRAVSGVYNKVLNFRHLDPRDSRAGLPNINAIDRTVWNEFYDVTRSQIMERELNDAHSALFFNKIQDSGQRISYREFGDAPNDDLIELQTFARRVRRGQRAFRDNLLLAYGSGCSITGEGPEEVLEAIHIVPHAESGINELDNGLLMRADLHHLFDDGLLSINPDTKNIEIDERLLNTSYWQFNGVRLRLRVDGTQISSNYLRQRVP